jgi:hypothetical protein
MGLRIKKCVVAYGAAKCVNDTTACNSSVPGSFVITLAKHYAGGYVANLECHANDAKYQLLLTADEMSTVKRQGNLYNGERHGVSYTKM